MLKDGTIEPKKTGALERIENEMISIVERATQLAVRLKDVENRMYGFEPGPPMAATGVNAPARPDSALGRIDDLLFSINDALGNAFAATSKLEGL